MQSCSGSTSLFYHANNNNRKQCDVKEETRNYTHSQVRKNQKKYSNINTLRFYHDQIKALDKMQSTGKALSTEKCGQFYFAGAMNIFQDTLLYNKIN